MSQIDRLKYIAEMKALLSFMDADDRDEVLRFYEARFDRAGAEGEQSLLVSMGSPVRQVLLVEKRYRQLEDGVLLEDDLNDPLRGLFTKAPVPETPVSPEETEESGNPSVPEWAPLAEGILSPETPALPQEEASQETAPLADTPYTAEETASIAAEPLREESSQTANNAVIAEEPLQAEPAIPESPEGETVLEKSVAQQIRELTRETAVPAKETPTAVPAAETPQQEAVREMLRSIDAEETAEPAKTQEKASGGRVFLAVLITPFMLVLFAVGIAVSVALACIGLCPGAMFSTAAAYLAMYATGGMSYLPDMLVLLGAAALALALALFFLWLGIWLLVGGVMLTIRVIGKIYRAVLGKGGSGNE